MFSFSIQAKEKNARAGIINIDKLSIPTPLFMPVGTQATVKAMTPKMLEELNVKAILSNIYHLYLRPRKEVIQKIGGLHKFCGFNDMILTDSGGFQLFSLRNMFTKDELGIGFSSPFDGSKHFLTPEDIIQIQSEINSDVATCLDVCPPYTDRYEIKESVEKTIRWAERSIETRKKYPLNALFGIIQGSVYKDLREMCMEKMIKMPFEGYAIGGLSTGESPQEMINTVELCSSYLPFNKPHYAMGIGTPEDILECVERGIDMFDCVLPTRNARNGMLFTHEGNIHIKNKQYTFDKYPIEEKCNCYTCRYFSRAYLRHLFKTDELLYYTLSTIHNLHFYISLMKDIRDAILKNQFRQFKENFTRKRNERID
ncbi:MAG: tRNA guanosine(34) transglycosylase Tgt [Deltaproteobacteria bacterium]|nr:tRNA guanosine(34) transglycosylase Tgt [Deltaproteobacteria bacterium]